MQVTTLLEQLGRGDREAAKRLFPLVYEELRRVARQHMAGETGSHTLQTTALVHEAYLRLAGSPPRQVRDLRHFLAVASRAMRHVLVDHARARRAQKAGGDAGPRLPLDDVSDAYEARSIDLTALHDSIERLGGIDAELASIVDLRFFAGLTMAEIAEALGFTERTVYAKWSLARAWLRGELGDGAAS
jgi:RNA polymerase sigma factor (TIGR02999 family)